MEWVRGEVIGRGCFSTVNVATTTSFDTIAVKSAGDAALLRHEKHVLDILGTHQNIIRCLGANVTMENSRKQYNLLLEYAGGGTLADQMRKFGGKLVEREIRNYAKQVLKGLSHVHSMGFAHLDIKPSNLLLTETGEVKIADFGLAERINTDEKTAEIRGTPMYMAPESVNHNDYGAACDVWAFGCSILELATNRPAWSTIGGDANAMSLLLRIGVGDEIPGIPDELSGEAKDFLLKCFKKDPSQRWTAEMLLQHPFVCNEEEDDLHGSCVSVSPRCVFDFPDEWSTSCSRSSGIVFLPEATAEASQPISDILHELSSNWEWAWEDKESWISVR